MLNAVHIIPRDCAVLRRKFVSNKQSSMLTSHIVIWQIVSANCQYYGFREMYNSGRHHQDEAVLSQGWSAQDPTRQWRRRSFHGRANPSENGRWIERMASIRQAIEEDAAL